MISCVLSTHSTQLSKDIIDISFSFQEPLKDTSNLSLLKVAKRHVMRDTKHKLLGVQKSSELFFVKFNLYSKTNEKIWPTA